MTVGARAALAIGLVSSLLHAGAIPARGESRDEVRLVLILVVDQLRRDRLGPELPGGLGELVRGGRVFRDSLVDHGVTETCPGHVVVSTGVHPGRAGIPSNRTIDPRNGERQYCVVDDSEGGRVLGHPEAGGRSPALLRVSALGDWMKAERPDTRVFSVSAKDRSAVALGGQRPDAAYWFAREGRVGFATSRHYMETLPAWVQAWNGEDPPRDGFLARVPERWEHAVEPAAHHGLVRADAFPAENSLYEDSSGHPIHDDDLEEFADRLYHSPFVDDVTLDFARQLVLHEELGRSRSPDLLALGLSATDLIGHFYGPESHESRDGLLRLDAAVGEFLAFLDEQLGPDHVLVALTADHGVLPLPEWLEATNRGRCATVGGRGGIGERARTRGARRRRGTGGRQDPRRAPRDPEAHEEDRPQALIVLMVRGGASLTAPAPFWYASGPHRRPCRLSTTRNGGSPRDARDVAQPGSALAWGARGRQFKSGRPDQFPFFLPASPRDRSCRA